MADDTQSLLEMSDLSVTFRTEDGDLHAVRGVDLSIEPGQILAVVGESGSGKSVTALSVLGLNPPSTTTTTGSIRLSGEELVDAKPERIREVRGGEIAMVFQDPLTALNPVYSVGAQIVEMVRAHMKVTKRQAWSRAVEMLGLVGIPQPDKRAKMYPHEFSGGMRQRAMIAMALSCEPKVIIADEPTTALDVTVQAQVLELLRVRAAELGAAVMLITHDLGVVAGLADRVAVMYAGLIVESGTTDEVFSAPTHPYTIGLLDSLPSLEDSGTGQLRAIGGQPPSMLRPPSGCAFHPRCRYFEASAGCDTTIPELDDLTPAVACHRRAHVEAALGIRGAASDPVGAAAIEAGEGDARQEGGES
jgi:peptide/nickel transport system ATP-binding protein